MPSHGHDFLLRQAKSLLGLGLWVVKSWPGHRLRLGSNLGIKYIKTCQFEDKTWTKTLGLAISCPNLTRIIVLWP